ncbi:MAG: hypothetical protein H0X36_01200 [Sphingomonadaceae bacterium]|nr:hypothetical protein [Sphingomonadaceae bacterium]
MLVDLPARRLLFGPFVRLDRFDLAQDAGAYLLDRAAARFVATSCLMRLRSIAVRRLRLKPGFGPYFLRTAPLSSSWSSESE